MIGSVTYGTRLIHYSFERRSRNTLDISVTPDGAVVVAAPLDATDEEISDRVRRKGRWIGAQQRYFAQFRPRTTPRQWLPGETHRYLGRQHRLRIGEPGSPIAVRRTRGLLIVDGIEFGDSAGLERVVQRWYRIQAHDIFTQRIERCLHRFDTASIAPSAVTVRSMTSRWASMSAAGRLSLNPALVQASVDTIDYVITHELAHRLEPHHGSEFWAVLDRVMPDHEQRKVRLERMLA